MLKNWPVSFFIAKFDEVARLNKEGYRNIGITLQRLEEVVAKGNENMNAALWMAFWPGAAWEKAVRDASEW